MKYMNKAKSIFVFALAFAALVLGCKNQLESEKCYLKVSLENTEDDLRTALPNFQEDELSDYSFVLKGTKNGKETDFGTYENLSSLRAASIPCEPGTWNFILTAEKDGSVLKGELISKDIVAGDNSLSFNLVWDKTELSGKGSLSFSIDFSRAENPEARIINCVTGELLSYNPSTKEETPLEDYPETEISCTDGNAVFELSNVDAGTYLVKIRLYHESNKKCLVNLWEEQTIISGGKESTASRELTSLNKVYTIRCESNGGIFEGGSVAFTAYATRLSEEIPLPNVTKAGYTFEGWYEKSDFSGNSITVIEEGCAGNKKVFAKYSVIPVLYVSSVTNILAPHDGNPGTEEYPLATLTGVANKIKEFDCPDLDYTVYVEGTITATESVDGGSNQGDCNILPSTLNEYAKSITLIGKNELLDGVPQDALVGTGVNSTALKINTNVPVTIRNLKISGGGANIYLGSWTSQYDPPNVTLGEGTLVTNNVAGSTTSCGVYIDIGFLTLDGGTISENVGDTCGGVYCKYTFPDDYDKSCFVMKSGSITGNHGKANAGGVYIAGGNFTMLGGTISENNADGNGGGVYVASSNTFNFEGGTISNNTAVDGAGVYVCETCEEGADNPVSGKHGTMNMKDGTISGNTASNNGGGVYLSYFDSGEEIDDICAVLNMSGGTISGNICNSDNDDTGAGAGVYVSRGLHVAELNISGDAFINQNNDVFLADDGDYGSAWFTVTGETYRNVVIGSITPGDYAEGTTILVFKDCEPDSPWDYMKYGVAPNGDDVWYITSEGKLTQTQP